MNIEIDDKLINDVLQANGLKTKREAVEFGLRTLLRLHRQEKIRSRRGKWNGKGIWKKCVWTTDAQQTERFHFKR